MRTNEVRPALLEEWGSNERMRHIPRLEWMIEKLDVTLRRRVDKLLVSFASLEGANPARTGLEERLRSVGRSLERLNEIAARQSRSNGHPPSEIGARLHWQFNQTVASLRANDAERLGRRFPFQTFERSKAEPLYGAILSTMVAVERAIETARGVDPTLDERLLEGSVNLQNPVDHRMLQPIA